MLKGTSFFQFSLFTVFCILASFPSVEASLHGNASALGYLVPKHERKHLVLTEYGEISAVKVSDGRRGSYHLQFITMEPNSLFLPVLLHADMVFYVHTGSGTLSWTDDNEMRTVNIRKGDIYRLHPGSFFYLQSSLEPEREKLRIYAIFSSKEENIYEPWIGAYSRISDVVLGFGSKVLQAAFEVPEDVIEEIMKATKPPAIIHAVPKKKKIFFEWQTRLLKAFLGSNRDGFGSINGKKKKKTKAYNVLEADPDFKNCNGWSLTVDKNDLLLLRDSNIGVFMVNLTKGSMMGPHWNSRASEIAVVLEGQGMIRVACSSNANESECKNLRFRVKEGDVFLVPMFHAMAQISFNNDSFVFMGFSTSTNRNYPQFLAGKSSVLGFLDRQILAVSFNVSNTTIDQLLTPQKDSVIFDCTSCAEEEESIMEEEIEREREEEEEARKKEEEEARKRKEEEEARKKEEEEARKREEEEARKRKEEDEARKKQEEEARKREEEEEAKKREEEEEEARKKEEGEARKREEEEEARKKEEEAARKREEEEEAKKREEEEKKRREEEARKEQEEARRQEEERQRRARQEEEEEEEEERKRQEEKEKERRRKEEQEQEEPKRRKGGQGREEAAARKQAKRQEQERQRRAEQEEEEARWEREKQGGQQEKRETEEEGSDEAQRRVPKKVWEI